MKKFVISLLFAYCTCYTIDSFCQAVNQYVKSNNFLMRLGRNNGKIGIGDVFVNLPSANDGGEVVGDPYWDFHWGSSALELYNRKQLIENYLTRYDIRQHEFEFKFDNDIKVLRGDLVKTVIWKDSLTQQPRYLVNAKDYREDNVQLLGFFEVLVDSTNSLFKKVYLEILKPDFSPALNVGSKNTRIIKKENYYYNINREVYKIKSAKSFDILFQDKKVPMNNFIKKERIKFNRESDLVKVFNYFLSLQ